MDDHSCQSKKAEEIFAQLEWIMQATERTISARKITLEESQKMSQCLTEMRLLLDELSGYEAWFGHNSQISVSKTGLVLRFIELEGKVKEVRNDLTKASGEKKLPAR